MNNNKKLDREQKEKQILEQFYDYIETMKNPPKKEVKPKDEQKNIECLEDEILEEEKIEKEEILEQIDSPKEQTENIETENIEIKNIETENMDKDFWEEDKEIKEVEEIKGLEEITNIEEIKEEKEVLEEKQEQVIEYDPTDLMEPEVSKTMFDLDLDDYLEKNKIVEEVENVDEDFWEEKIREDKEEPKKIHFLQPIAAACSFMIVLTLLVGVVSTTSLGTLAMNVTGEENEVEFIERDIHIKKQAEWIAKNKVSLKLNVDSEIEYDNRTRDIVILLDTSTGMSDHISRIKNDLETYMEFVLKENKNSRIALVSFNETATEELPFTNDINKLNSKLRSIPLNEGRNYNEALTKLDEMLYTYSVKERPLKVLLITGGIPDNGNYSIPGTYAILKDKHDNLEIEGIQYNLGAEELLDLKEATDRVWISNQESFSNTLKEASLDPEKLRLEVTELISSDFKIKSVNTNYGEAEVKGQNVIWNVSKNRFATGSKAEIEILLELTKVNALRMDEFKVSEKTIFKTDGGEKKQLNVTPTLKNYYEVKYIGNGPTGCKFDVPQTKKHYVFDVVKVEEKEPTCKGFRFRGWTLSSDEKKLNDNLFVMPAHDVEIRGVWSTFKITSQMR